MNHIEIMRIILHEKGTEKVFTLSINIPRFVGQNVILFDAEYPLALMKKNNIRHALSA